MGVPTHDQISKSIHEYFFFKKSCLLSFFECGSAYNKEAFTGPFQECGNVDVFGIWKKNVNERRAAKYI